MLIYYNYMIYHTKYYYRMLQCTFETRTRNTIVKLSSIKFIPLESLIDNSSSGSSFTRRERFICTATNFFLPFVSFPLPPSPPPTKRKKEAGPKYRSLCSQALVTFATVTHRVGPRSSTIRLQVRFVRRPMLVS